MDGSILPLDLPNILAFIRQTPEVCLGSKSLVKLKALQCI